MVIWKVPLEITDYQNILIPWGSQVLSCQEQNGVPTIWFTCMPPVNEDQRQVGVRIAGTGHYLDGIERRGYVGTVQIKGLVWHIFMLPTVVDVSKANMLLRQNSREVVG